MLNSPVIESDSHCDTDHLCPFMILIDRILLIFTSDASTNIIESLSDFCTVVIQGIPHRIPVITLLVAAKRSYFVDFIRF